VGSSMVNSLMLDQAKCSLVPSAWCVTPDCVKVTRSLLSGEHNSTPPPVIRQGHGV